MRSIKNRLALLFLGIVLAALATIWFYVVPQLESRLRDEKLHNLAIAARQYSPQIQQALVAGLGKRQLNRVVKQAGDTANARVTLFLVAPDGRSISPRADSTADILVSDLEFPAAEQTLRSGKPATSWESSSTGPQGEAAVPIRVDRTLTHVVVLSASLSDVQSNVAVVRRRILVAGAIALLVAVLAGYLVASAVARRVKRLERAARKVAAGDFSESIRVDSADELGQLAIAFNDMQRQLAQLDSARKRFIAIASHELRTPIFQLGGFIELLEDDELDEATRQEFLAHVRGQIGRLTTLASELLDLSRLEAGSLELRPEPTDLGDLTRRVAAEFAPAVAQHASRLDVRVPDADLEAACDPERVAQIIRILVDNALTHTPPGTEVEVSAMRENGTMRLAVRDAGPGIKRADLARVFEPFYTSDDLRGSGLGLAIARELAEHMDGRLAVASSPGRTTFTLELPG